MTWVVTKENTSIENKDGVTWSEAPLPKRFHKCRPQSRGWIKFSFIERCACGAHRYDGCGSWMLKNSRRKGN